MEQAERTFDAMPNTTETEKRDKALFAFFMLTGARDGAVATLKIKHIDLEGNHVFQDARQVSTKNAKTIDTWFFPVAPIYRATFAAWVVYLRKEKLFGSEDALFPKPENAKPIDGKFVSPGLSRCHYAGAAKLNAIIKDAFAMRQMPEYTPHSFRKTLAIYGDQICTTMEQRKAWSMNLGHENLVTTVNAYMPVDRMRQRNLTRNFCFRAP